MPSLPRKKTLDPRNSSNSQTTGNTPETSCGYIYFNRETSQRPPGRRKLDQTPIGWGWSGISIVKIHASCDPQQQHHCAAAKNIRNTAAQGHHSFVSSVSSRHFRWGFRQMRWLLTRARLRARCEAAESGMKRLRQGD